MEKSSKRESATCNVYGWLDARVELHSRVGLMASAVLHHKKALFSDAFRSHGGANDFRCDDWARDALNVALRLKCSSNTKIG